jgi:hypothetical protein
LRRLRQRKKTCWKKKPNPCVYYWRFHFSREQGREKWNVGVNNKHRDCLLQRLCLARSLWLSLPERDCKDKEIAKARQYEPLKETSLLDWRDTQDKAVVPSVLPIDRYLVLFVSHHVNLIGTRT